MADDVVTTTPAEGGTADSAAPQAGNTDAPGGEDAAGQTVVTPPAPAADGGAAAVVLDGKADTGTGENSPDTAGDGDNGSDGGDGDDGGQGEPAAATPFVYPEGMAGDPEAETALRAFAREKNLSAGEQQALVDIQVGLEQKRNAYLLEKTQELKAEWARELAADPEFGGAHLPQTNKDANLGLRHYAPELIPLLPQWNLETNSALVKHFARLGRGLRENRSPRAEGPGEHKPKTLVDAKAAMLAEQEKAAARRR